MELRRLSAFVEVAANGSYSRAAGTLGVAQSVLSRQVATLERTIGGRLFHRTGRGVALTELGERVLPRARALVSDEAALLEAAKSGIDQPTGEVNLGIVPVASCHLMAALTLRLRERLPGIRLRVLEDYSGQVEEWLASGRVEIAIYNRYRRGSVPGAEPLMRTEMHLITRRGSPLVSRREIALRALAEVPLAVPVYPNSLTSLLTGLAAAQHFGLDIKFESGSTSLTKEAILSSGLATISPPDVFAREIETGELGSARIVRPAIWQTTWMSVSSHRPPSAAGAAVVRLIGALAKRRPARANG